MGLLKLLYSINGYNMHYKYGISIVYVWYKICKFYRTYVSLIISSTKFTKFVTY